MEPQSYENPKPVETQGCGTLGLWGPRAMGTPSLWNSRALGPQSYGNPKPVGPQGYGNPRAMGTPRLWDPRTPLISVAGNALAPEDAVSRSPLCCCCVLKSVFIPEPPWE